MSPILFSVDETDKTDDGEVTVPTLDVGSFCGLSFAERAEYLLLWVFKAVGHSCKLLFPK